LRRHVSDLGGEISEAELSLVRRAAALAIELEAMEACMSRGEQVDIDRFGRAASHLRRLFETLGLKRKPRDISVINGYSPLRDGWDDDGQPEGKQP
jgi:hypothetical protein